MSTVQSNVAGRGAVPLSVDDRVYRATSVIRVNQVRGRFILGKAVLAAI